MSSNRVKEIYFYYFFSYNSRSRFNYTFLDGSSEFTNALIFERSIIKNRFSRWFYIIISDREIKGFLNAGQYSRPSYFHFYRKYEMKLGSKGFNNYLYGASLEQYGNALTNIKDLGETYRSVERLLRNEILDGKIF